MKFKDIMTLDEMINHLEKNKNVVFNENSKEDAKKILYKYGYINVITPFKFKYAKRYKILGPNKYTFKNKDGNHVYVKATDFNSYYSDYLNERSSYDLIMKNINNFETVFKSISAYE